MKSFLRRRREHLQELKSRQDTQQRELDQSYSYYRTDLILCFFVLDLIGPQWDEQIRLLAERCEDNDIKLYSCKNRCGVEERDVSVPMIEKDLPRCYCDKLCDDFGDCCFDFDALYVSNCYICRKEILISFRPLNTLAVGFFS